MPFAIILGEDEQAQGKVKIKEMGATGPDKEGVLVDLKDLIEEIKSRLQKKDATKGVPEITPAIEGLDLKAPQVPIDR